MRAPRLRLLRLTHGLVAAAVAASCDASPTPPTNAGPADASTCPAEEALWEDIEPSTFTALQFPTEGRLIANVNPKEPATYWELRRYSAAAPSYKVLASDAEGEKCSRSSDPVGCRRLFNQLTPLDEGFGQDGGPEQYESHLAINRVDSNAILSSRQGLVVFLGEIDTPAEAALVAHADGFTTQSVREAEDGYELLVTEYTRYCAPILVERVLLFVARDGNTTERRRQTASVDCAGCI